MSVEEAVEAVVAIALVVTDADEDAEATVVVDTLAGKKSSTSSDEFTCADIKDLNVG